MFFKSARLKNSSQSYPNGNQGGEIQFIFKHKIKFISFPFDSFKAFFFFSLGLEISILNSSAHLWSWY